MLKKLQFKTIIILISGLLGLVGLCLALLLAFTIHNVEQVQDNWNAYQADRSEKPRLESVLRAAMGYGGMIHHFKNYVLRQQPDLSSRTQSDIGAARIAINQYNSLITSSAEDIALDDIAKTIDKYENGLYLAQQLIQQGASPEKIDEVVIVDDTAAFSAFATLNSEVRNQVSAAVDYNNIKGRVLADLRASIGYGGLIHEIKNLVLRYEHRERIGMVVEKIKTSRHILKEYQNLGLSVAENIALEDIVETIDEYEANLNRLIEIFKRTEGLTATEIDKIMKVDDEAALRGLSILAKETGMAVSIDNIIRVDDEPALRALKTLDREIYLQIQRLSSNVSSKLDFLSTIIPRLNWFFIIVMILAISISIWLFNNLVISRVMYITGKMNELAKDNTDIEIAGSDFNNEIGQMAQALEKFKDNIIEKESAKRKIMEIAITDPLTGLYNRRHLNERLTEEFNRAKRYDSGLTLIIFDIDYFKKINDTWGHAAGDEVLKVIAEYLKQSLRGSDLAARIGGEEFCIVFPTNTSNSGMLAVIERMRIEISNLECKSEGNLIQVTCSFGVATYSEAVKDADDLIKRADTALYQAKESGRNRVKVFET